MKKYYKFALFSILGGLIGYSYYYFVGCSGGCPLTSRWYVTTIYGLLAGIVFAMPNKNKPDNSSLSDNSSSTDNSGSSDKHSE